MAPEWIVIVGLVMIAFYTIADTIVEIILKRISHETVIVNTAICVLSLFVSLLIHGLITKP